MDCVLCKQPVDNEQDYLCEDCMNELIELIPGLERQ